MQTVSFFLRTLSLSSQIPTFKEEMKTKVLVTGGAGFIGSHTVIALNDAGFEPIIADNFSNSEPFILERLEKICNRSFTFSNTDFTKPREIKELFEQHQPDAVIHFAAFKAVGESVQEPLKYYHNNVVSMIHLMEIMTEFNVKDLVFSSSCTVYGEPDKIPVTENSAAGNAVSPYGRTKVICEDILRDAFSANMAFRSSLLRYFNPIGAHPSGLIGELPRGVPNNLVPYITQTAAGWRNQLTIHGNDYSTSDGTCIRDYIHVVDLAEAHVAALEFIRKSPDTPILEVFNVGTGEGSSVLQAVKAFESATGQPLNYTIGPRRAGDVEKIFADTNKVKNALNWEPKKSLNDAMADAWRWQQTLKKPE